MTSSILFSSPLVKFSSSSALWRRTVPFVSVPVISRPHPRTSTLQFNFCCSVPEGGLPTTMPSTTKELLRELPLIFATRTLSTSNFFGSLGITFVTASATRAESSVSSPYCFAAMAGFTAFWTCLVSFKSVRLQQVSPGSVSSTVARALSNPLMMSAVCRPILQRASAWVRSSPANVTTKLVAFPNSCSCMDAAPTTSLAAGCITSSSDTILAAFEVT
mmetsp:Transcript_4251/g.8647  ORF Transcript_4251/g.8647 Transcript_4251/m.8647 type:complete len:218 (-) Transcript_4251:472-1125(-)